jgi:hypothetical protein
MSEFVQQALPIAFMFGVVSLLGPLVGITMWMAFDGDRVRPEAQDATEVEPGTAREAAPATTGRPATAA